MSWYLLQAMTCPAFMSFGFSEILLVGVVALLVFGGNLPDVMRSLGRSYGKLRRSLQEFSRPVRDELREVKRLPPPESRPRSPEDAEEYPDYGAPPEPEDKAESEPGPEPARAEPDPPAVGAADEPPPV